MVSKQARDVSSGEVVCQSCGASVVPGLFCRKCGVRLAPSTEGDARQVALSPGDDKSGSLNRGAIAAVIGVVGVLIAVGATAAIMNGGGDEEESVATTSTNADAEVSTTSRAPRAPTTTERTPATSRPPATSSPPDIARTTLAPATTSAPLAVPRGVVDCDGSWLTVVASTPLINVELELDRNAGSKVLKTDESCESLNPTFSAGAYAGQSIHVVFYGPFATSFAAQEQCLNLGKFKTNDCYVAPLTNNPADRSVRYGPSD
jgi:transcription initiation factor TFIIIB Brf1 subunit/transcription initiation factor TFIIB